jgi:hypothetical protein
MENENFSGDKNNSEYEEEVMLALPDSDVDELGNQLINMATNYESEEYR